MIITLTDTTTAHISSALLRARRSAGSPAMGMVLTLLVVCQEKEYESALKAAMESGREHPARILLVVHASGRVASLDAEVRIGEGTPGEVVVIRMYGPLASHPASVVRPLLLPDSPVVIWWPGKAPANIRDDELAGLAVRRVTDAAAAKRPLAELKIRATTYQPGDTDLSWTRLTRWRALLAAALDQYPARILAATVEAERCSPSADLLAAWLQSCLKVKVARKNTAGPGMTAVRMTTAAGDIAITRSDGLLASYAVPGQLARLVALKRRETTELITEELRRMDDDDVYAHALLALQQYSQGASPAKTASTRPSAEKAASTRALAPETIPASSRSPVGTAAAKRPAAGKTSTKKATSKRAAATKATTEAAPARRAAAATAAANKAAAKRTTATKASATKVPAKKATAKRTTAKRAAKKTASSQEG
ncbi:MAG TPA: glucose-6-phosphate dehydrogenase assembly protein OpcA [Candidatus Limnocylindria bacterium]|nr:glucose-6-phosphate dehydrogenase assembly protein OpcA [Candidatus Limnocylindria bacterium]